MRAVWGKIISGGEWYFKNKFKCILTSHRNAKYDPLQCLIIEI